MSEPISQPEKEVIVATEKRQVSFRMVVAGLSVAIVAGLAIYAWQENIFLAILAAIIGFVYGYLTGTLVY